MLRGLLAALFMAATLIVPGQAAAAPDGKTFVLFEKVWCIGEVSPLTHCDVSLGRTPTTQRNVSERLSTPDPIDALRRATHQAARTAATRFIDLHQLEQRLRGTRPESLGVR
jgi:hypothetical protein